MSRGRTIKLGLIAALSFTLSFVIAAPVLNSLMIDIRGWGAIARFTEPVAGLPRGSLGPFGHDGDSFFNTTLHPQSLRREDGSAPSWTAHLAPTSEGAQRAVAFSALILVFVLGCYPLAIWLQRRFRYRNLERATPIPHRHRLLSLIAGASPIAALTGVLITVFRIAWTGANNARVRSDAQIDTDQFLAVGPVALAMIAAGSLLLAAPLFRWMVLRAARFELPEGSCPSCGYGAEAFPCPECGHDPDAPVERPSLVTRATPWALQGLLIMGLLMSPWLLTVTLGPVLG